MQVKDLDPLMKRYDVVVVGGKIIGTKSYDGKYRRPFKRKSDNYDNTIYKSTPPWMSFEAVEITHNTIWVKDRKQ